MVLRGLEDGGAVDVGGVDLGPAWTLQVTKLLFICSVAVWGEKNHSVALFWWFLRFHQYLLYLFLST